MRNCGDACLGGDTVRRRIVGLLTRSVSTDTVQLRSVSDRMANCDTDRSFASQMTLWRQS